MQGLDAVVDLVDGNAQFLGHFLLSLLVVGQELMQRRIEGPDGYGVPLHRAEQPREVLPLEGKQLGQGGLAGLRGGGQDHLPHLADVVEEHVLGSAEANAFRTEGDRLLRLGRAVCVGADV